MSSNCIYVCNFNDTSDLNWLNRAFHFHRKPQLYQVRRVVYTFAPPAQYLFLKLQQVAIAIRVAAINHARATSPGGTVSPRASIAITMNEVTRKTPLTCIELESHVKFPYYCDQPCNATRKHAGRDPPQDSSGIWGKMSAPAKSFGFSCWARKATCLPSARCAPFIAAGHSSTVSTVRWSGRLLSLNRDFRPTASVTRSLTNLAAALTQRIYPKSCYFF